MQILYALPVSRRPLRRDAMHDAMRRDAVCLVRWRQAIVGVIQHLRARAQTAKLTLYVNFRRVLVGSIAFAVAWAVYGVVRSSEVETVR